MPEPTSTIYIKDKQLAENNWTKLAADFSGDLPEQNCLVPFKFWLENREALASITHIGLWLDSDDEVEALGDQANRFQVIAINFPTFMDGRGFSLGRLLRERFGFKGELRAIGNVIRDQLFYLKRCGFNGFEITLAGSPEEVTESLSDFTETYQGAADDPAPLFRRQAG